MHATKLMGDCYHARATPINSFAALDYPNQDERQLIWNQLESWLATLETSFPSEQIREIFNGVQGTELEPFFLDEKMNRLLIFSKACLFKSRKPEQI